MLNAKLLSPGSGDSPVAILSVSARTSEATDMLEAAPLRTADIVGIPRLRSQGRLERRSGPIRYGNLHSVEADGNTAGIGPDIITGQTVGIIEFVSRAFIDNPELGIRNELDPIVVHGQNGQVVYGNL